jgi:hypothetical protein
VEGVVGFLKVIWFSGIIGFGLLQISATIAGLKYWFGGYATAAFIIGIFLGPIPFLGGILGIVGAMKVWNWTFLGASALFLGLPLLLLVIVVAQGLFEHAKNKTRVR